MTYFRNCSTPPWCPTWVRVLPISIPNNTSKPQSPEWHATASQQSSIIPLTNAPYPPLDFPTSPNPLTSYLDSTASRKSLLNHSPQLPTIFESINWLPPREVKVSGITRIEGCIKPSLTRRSCLCGNVSLNALQFALAKPVPVNGAR